VQKRNREDLLFYALLIALGAIAFTLSCRASDFVGDAYYFELARSIAKGAGYVFDFRPQTMLPPGLPYMLAFLTTMLGGVSYAGLVRLMPIFSTLALIASYEVLRVEESRWVAAAACLMLGSSPEVFEFSTKLVFSDMPYFCTSMILLWLIMRLDSTEGRPQTRTAWWLLAVVLMIGSVLMRSTGIALAVGILGWVAISSLTDRRAARRRIKVFLPLVIAGIAVQGIWMQWAARHQFSEWPVHGYQENYLAQLKLKNGNDPEMGMATWRDVLLRPVHNLDDRAGALVGLLTRKQMAPAWYSPGTVIPLALILLGLAVSFSRNGGGPLDWYFVMYEALFMFWPWDFELRFLLPVVPLACLYMWRGGVLLSWWARAGSRGLSISALVVAVAGMASSMVWGRQVEHPGMWSCVVIWALVACVSISLPMGRGNLVRGMSLLWRQKIRINGRPRYLGRVLAATLVGTVVMLGAVKQARIGSQNYHFDLKTDGSYPNIEAAEWISQHSTPSAVIMARKEDLVFHYTQHKVVWFPPSTDPKVLMSGIRQYHVQYVVVVDNDNYWRPTSRACFEALSGAYPGKFQIVHKGLHDEVFVVENPS
jgi:hypothetical protein